MGSSNWIGIAFLVIVHGNELTIGSVELRAVNAQWRLGEMAYCHLLLPQMPASRLRPLI